MQHQNLLFAKAIKPLDITFAIKALYKNVFPVPPGPSMKKHLIYLNIPYQVLY